MNDASYIYALASLAGGIVVSLLSYLPAYLISKRKTAGFSVLPFVLRIIVDGAYLSLLFFLSRSGILPGGTLALMIGGAVGITLVMIVFTVKSLLSLTQSGSGEENKRDG